MSNRIVGQEMIEVDIDPAQIHLYLRVEAEEWTPTTEVRARLVGPTNALARTNPVPHGFEPLKSPEEDVEPEVHTFEVQLPDPALWSPETPNRYEGEVELWQDGVCVDSMPLHYAVYMLGWDEDMLLVNDQEMQPRLREVATLDEASARTLRSEGVNIVLLPASETAAWEVADCMGLFVLGVLPSDGALPSDLVDRSIRPCCLGWIFSSDDMPMPDEVIPGLFGMCSDLPFEELPEGIDFLLLDQPPEMEADESLGYPWIARSGE